MTAADKKEMVKAIDAQCQKILKTFRAELQEATGRNYGGMVCTECQDATPKRYKDPLAPSRSTCKKCGGEMKWQKAV